jgi:S-ribosylhomocysteine lyase
MNIVESFALDHDMVTAPYVRKAKVARVDPKFPDCLISKFDVRFAQPNEEFLENGALHTLEHFFAILVREYTDDLIDISPMGCRTGFYFIFSGDKDVMWVAKLVRRALAAVGAFEGVIPGAARKECGNYREHDLAGAKQWAARFMSIPEGDVVQIHREK